MSNDLANGRCLGCGEPLPESFLDLGPMPLANSYLPPTKPAGREPMYPLAVAFCPSCYLTQLADRVDPEELFRTYLYFSSFSDTFLAHARQMTSDLIGRFSLNAGSRVLEVASNDGYLLKCFRERGIPILGIEPARNLAEEAGRNGIPTLPRFFGPDVVPEVVERFGAADLLVGNNVLAHVPEINRFLGAVRDCLSANGVAVFEVPYLGELLRNTEFDTIYHEHVFYYSLNALDVLARRSGLQVFDVQRQAIHGGSIRIFLQRPAVRAVREAVGEVLSEEKELGFLSPRLYDGFGTRVREIRRRLKDLLQELKREGRRIAAYGAPAKGNTLLNYCGVDRGLVDFTVDRSPHKQGLLLPGSRIPVLDPRVLSEEMPDFTLILAWNWTSEIASQQSRYLEAGGKFIVPIPRPRVIGAAQARALN